MGCDIHLVLERKYEGEWIGMREVTSRPGFTYNETDETWEQNYILCRASARNYDLFARLAGVRGMGPEPKGVPEDASELSRALINHWDADGHSHSYCSLQEYIEALGASEDNPAEVFLKDHPAVAHPHQFYFGMYPPDEDEEYRVVFWFDN